MHTRKILNVLCLILFITGCEFFTTERVIIPETVVTRANFNDLLGTYDSTTLGRGEGSKTTARLKITDSSKTEKLQNGLTVDLLNIEYLGNTAKPEELDLKGTLALSELPKKQQGQTKLYIASVLFETVNGKKQEEKKYFFFIVQKDVGKNILGFWMPNSESKAIKDIAKSPHLLPPDQSLKVKKQNTQSIVNWARTSGRDYVKFDKPYIFKK